MTNKEWKMAELQQYQKEAEELGISLQEYLLLLIYEKLEDIKIDTGCIG